jgi:flagellar basal-body rod modification protein FlgD
MDTSINSYLENIISTSSTQTATASQAKTMGKDDFMKLLLAQLKNQDPLKPIDGTDFAAQLAQFSSLEQMSNMNSELKTQSLNQIMLQYTQSMNMIGKVVVANSGSGVRANGSSTELNYNLAEDAQTVTISILNKDGKQIETWDETGQKAGMNKVTWNCADVDKGVYTFQISAKDHQGQAIVAESMTSGLVTAISFKNNQISATVDGQEVQISDIVEVKQLEST